MRRPIALAVIAATAGCLPAPRDPGPPPASTPTSEEVRWFEERKLMVPVHGVRPRDLRDTFNDPRSDGRTHRALDIMARRGTRVVAATSGQVLRLNQNAAGGITAWLTDEERRFVYYYAHLSHYSDRITEGLPVKQGFVIGYVGTSGNAPPDTPHLHFQVLRWEPDRRDWWNGTPVDVRGLVKRKGKARR